MARYLLTLIFILFVATAWGQKYSRTELRYKPKTLNEAVAQLQKIHHDTQKQKIMAMTEMEFRTAAHRGVGMYIRNNWRLWRGGKLAKHFRAMGVYHPDDMSGIILTCYYRTLKKQDWELDKQVGTYQDYWEIMKDRSDADSTKIPKH